MNIIPIYDGEDACTQCLGWKRVDDGEGASWKYWAELPAQSAIGFTLGLVKPIQCPRCKGTGIEPKGELVKKLIATVRRLLDNIYEFGAPTDSIFAEQVEDALRPLFSDGGGGRSDVRLRKAAQDLIDYRRRAGPLNFQLEKADDFLREIQLALEGEVSDPPLQEN